MRYVTGWFAARTAGPEIRPSGGREILTVPGARAWAVGHDVQETVFDAAPDGSTLVAAGHCLATSGERRAALAVARTGDLRHAVRLPGSFLTLLWIGGALRVAGDRAGGVPVYWCQQGGVTWWSTAAAPLAALIGTTPAVPVLLADLTLFGVDTQLDHSRYEGVRRVPPGHALLLRPGIAPSTERLPQPGPFSFDQGARQLREALTTAVERRAQAYERVSADLSGGMDSSTVTCLAARIRPTVAVTYTDAHMAEDDDLIYAARTAADVCGITHKIIDAREHKAAQFDGLEDPAALPATDSPSLALGQLAVKAAQLAPAAAHATQAHLTGRGGDNVLTTEHSFYVDQFRAGRRRAALSGAASYARAQKVAPWRVWRQLGRSVVTSYPRALDALARTIAGPRPLAVQRAARWENLAWCGISASAGWLTGAGRRAVADLVDARAQAADPHTTPAALHDRLNLEFMAGSHAGYDAIARQRWDVPIHAPFLDTSVVSACLAIPSYDRIREGTYKPLAQAAFNGLVPDFLLRRQTKTAFTNSLYTGLATNGAALRRIVATSTLAQAGLLDPRRAAADLETAIAGAPAPLADLHMLLVTELWLDSLQTDAATWWRPDTDRSPSCG
ncbi:asparagine synthase-related protein [Streptomyces sp. NPDC091212]|uniref:asparagine synthase-related protein n=1 Tax=Streptomyces sp. NPDC091212 TaxID=3155191 RepID=UPI0034399AE2